jgi:pyridoxal phosphate enzyme (YggS family)
LIAADPVAERLLSVRARIAAAAKRAGRSADDVTLIGISKTMPAARVQAAVDAGLTDIGENRVQEAEEKIHSVRSRKVSLTWHLVGHLQQNKARRAVALFPWVHSVDSASLAEKIDRLAEELGVRPVVLIEVNLASEPTKTGVAPEALGPLLEAVGRLGHLKLGGLMAVPPALLPGQTSEGSRASFGRLATLRDTWRSRGYDLPALSMGMTDDFEVAIEEGATHVRVGRAIFGDRPAALPPAETKETIPR